ncbi:MAG TPA: HEAT repeat domain-containing protein [Phycisphaerae bacterium]
MVRPRPRAVSIVLVLSAGFAARTAAQNQASPLAPLRNLATFAPAQEAIMTDWINAQIQAWKSNTNKDAADDAFRQALNAEFNTTPGSEAYRNRLMELFVAICLQEFGQGKQGDPLLARTLARTLAESGRMGAIDALEKGLSHPDMEVRFICAKGFVALMGNILLNTTLTKHTTQILQEAAEKESNPVVLTRIYFALRYPAEKAGEVLEPIIAILGARLERWRQDPRSADAGDTPGLEYLLQHVAKIGAPQRSTLVNRLATMLRLDVTRLADEKLRGPQKDDLAYRVYLEERLLTEIAPPPNPGTIPSIIEAYQRGGTNARRDMLDRLNAWIGTPEKRSHLNDPPWNVPLGAP